MKKAFKHLLVLTCLAVNLASCEQNSIEEISEVANIANVTNESLETISFKYNEKAYKSSYQVIDNQMIFNNKEVQEIQEKIANNPNLATLVTAEGNYEYFENYEELQKSLRKPEFLSDISTRSTTISAKLTTHLHIDVGYSGGGQTYEKYLPSQLPPGVLNQVWIADMSTIALDKKGLNQKLSSIQLLSTVYDNLSYGGFLTIWDNKNFTGYSATWKLTSGTPNIRIKDLRYVIRGPIPSTLNWNDVAQSLKFGY